MSIETISTLQLMALGRPFQLGMLYDVRNDQLIPGITLWDPKTLEENIQSKDNTSKTSYKISTGDTLEEKSAMLGISAELKLSVLAGLVQVSGSAEYIKDRKKTDEGTSPTVKSLLSSDSVHKVDPSELTGRVTLQYSTRTRFDQLTMAHLGEGNPNHPEIFNQKIATHVVTGIVYGAEAFFLFDRSFSNTEDRTEVHSSIKAALEKIPKVGISADTKHDWTEEEKKMTDQLTCQFYGDFNLKANPSTFEEAVKLYKELPSLLGTDDKKAVAKQIYLYPLYLLDKSAGKLIQQINNSLVSKAVLLMEYLHHIEIKANDLKNSIPSKSMLQQVKQQLSTFCDRIFEFENDMKGKLMEILPKIRNGTTDEKVLAELFEQVDTSPFNKQKLEDWLEIKTQDIAVIKFFTSNLAEVNNIDVPSSALARAQSSLDCKFVFYLVTHVIDKNDSFLFEMYQYIKDGNYHQKHENTSINHWSKQDDIFESSRQTITMFIKFAQANKNNRTCQFIAHEQYVDDFKNTKGVSILFYKNGVRTNFNIASEPEGIHATVIGDRRVKIEWSKPQFGSESIQKYEIYGQKSSDVYWQLLSTTANATESTMISDINGIYRFKIKGITLYGVTSESDISNIIEVGHAAAPPPAQKKVKRCHGNACNRCGKCTDWYYDGFLWQRHAGATCSPILHSLGWNFHGLGDLFSRCRCKD